MIKNEMVTRTIEGFIRQLKKDGHHKYASELRTIIAMSRARKEALSVLYNIRATLLTHIIKYIAIPQSTGKNKWRREIKSYLSIFNVNNRNYKGLPWLSIEYIQHDLNDVLRGPAFLDHIKRELTTYPDKDRDRALNLLETHKTLKSMGIKLFFDSSNDIAISIGGQPL
jgi:septum formation topological specificity factor MinE